MNKKFACAIRALKYLVTLLIAGTVAYFLAALFLSYLPVIPKDRNCDPNKTIYITSNGVHLDIVLPVSNINKQFISKLEIPEGTQFVSFGWGDKNFYAKTPEWSDLTIPVAFKALFLKSESAMHVTLYRRSYSHWRTVKICDQQLDSLNAYIENSFEKTTDGAIQKSEFPGYTSSDHFYEAKRYFTLFRTCNVWTNNALKEIEVKTSVWSPFDFGVLYHLPE